MRSVAGDLREDTRRRADALTPGQRIDLALALGDEDVAALAAGRAISLRAARNLVARSRQVGRQPSCANGD